MIEITKEFAEQLLDTLEGDWLQIDQEWGPTTGGLEAEIASGGAEEIRILRELISGAKDDKLC